MFKKLFKKYESIEFNMPISGEVVAITEAPDPVFSEKMMGDGFCINPLDGKVYSPVKGLIVSVFPTKHCVGIRDEVGREWLIHFGMDTVKLNGEGFDMHVTEGQNVLEGDLLFEVDIDSVKESIPSLITPVVITNLEDKTLSVTFTGNVTCNNKYEMQMSK